MNKLKQAELLPALSVSFTTQVKELVGEAKNLSKSYADLTERKLKFADRFRTLWDEANSLDGNKDHGQHKAHFLKVLGQVVNTDNRSIWSRWVTIGKHAKELLPYKAALPSQRDSLYALALATKEGKHLERWIDDGKLTNESTMRDVQSLCKKRPRTTEKKQQFISVTFEMGGSYEDAAQTLSDLIGLESVRHVRSQRALQEALKGQLGKDSYAAIEQKFA